jgi:hypothetical protein
LKPDVEFTANARMEQTQARMRAQISQRVAAIQTKRNSKDTIDTILASMLRVEW